MLTEEYCTYSALIYYNIYIVGIGVGTLLGNCVFIFGGKWMVQRIANSEQYLNWVIGGIFTVTALIQLVMILQKKDAISKFGDSKDNTESN